MKEKAKMEKYKTYLLKDKKGRIFKAEFYHVDGVWEMIIYITDSDGKRKRIKFETMLRNYMY